MTKRITGPEFNLLVYSQLAGGMIAFGSATPVSKIVAGALPVFPASLLRVAIGALVLAPFVWGQLGRIKSFTRGDWIALCGITVFGMVGFSAFMLYGMALISGVAGAIVMATTPAVTALAAVAFFGERATWRKAIAVALAVAGVIILHISGVEAEANKGAGRFILGAGLIFAAVCCESAYTLLGRKLSQNVSPLLAAFAASAASIPIFAILAAFQWSGVDAGALDLGQWVAIIWYGAGTLALGTALWYSGLSKTEGSIAAVFMGVMPISALVLSYALLGEAFHWAHLVGFGIVFASVALISREHAKMS